jgi:predicted permease
MTSGSFAIEGRPVDPNNLIMGSKMLVGGDYFRALRIPLVGGRFFTAQDEQLNAPLVTIIDQTFAKRYFPGESAVGKHLNFEWGGSASTEIVGVVGSTKEMSLAAGAEPTVYAPMAQRGIVMVHSNVFMAVRSSGDPMRQAQSIKNVIHEFNSQQIVEHVRTMDDLIDESVASHRAPMWLFGVFAGIAVLLAAIGVYGILSYYVRQRKHEIGTRIALGAQRSDVLRLVLGHATRLIAGGLIIGLGITLASGRSLTSLLFATKPIDPATLIAASGLLALIGLLAAAVPAMRAIRVDPQTVLRNE